MKQNRNQFLFWWGGLLLSFGAAYWASRPKDEASDAKTAIVTLDLSQISKLSLISPEDSIVAIKRSDLVDRWWISADHKGKPQAQSAAEVKPTSDRFLSSTKFKEMMNALAPFSALRVIGKVEPAQLTDFGLKDASKFLKVEDSSGKVLLSLAIGKQLYGSRNLYVLNQADQAVLLIAGDFISDLEKPEIRFYERSFTSIALDEIQSAQLVSGEKSHKLLHSKRDSKGTVIWTSEGASLDPVPSAASWFEKLDRLKAIAYATEDEQRSLNSLPSQFEVTINGVGTATDVIQGRKTNKGGQDEYWIKSTYLGWHIKVTQSRADVLFKDVPQLLQNP